MKLSNFLKSMILAFFVAAVITPQAFAGVHFFNTSGASLGNFSEVSCGTGMTCDVYQGKLRIVSSPSLTGTQTLENGETFGNTTDDTVFVASDDNDTIFRVEGFEAKTASINLCADQCDDTADKFAVTMDAADLLTMTTGATQAATVSTAGLWTLPAATVTGAVLANGAVTLGDAITDITTFTGKIAGASPLSFDGSTADTVYTIIAITDPTSSSKTVTIPAVTGTVKLKTAATQALTPGAAVTLTVLPGTDAVYTDTITTDNQDQTITFSGGGTAGDIIRILFQTDSGGSNDEVITFETTLTNSAGTLTLANLTAGRYSVVFQSDGTVWNEIGRTTALS